MIGQGLESPGRSTWGSPLEERRISLRDPAPGVAAPDDLLQRRPGLGQLARRDPAYQGCELRGGTEEQGPVFGRDPVVDDVEGGDRSLELHGLQQRGVRPAGGMPMEVETTVATQRVQLA